MLAVGACAAVSLGVQMSLPCPGFVSSGCVSRSGVAEASTQVDLGAFKVREESEADQFLKKPGCGPELLQVFYPTWSWKRLEVV